MKRIKVYGYLIVCVMIALISLSLYGCKSGTDAEGKNICTLLIECGTILDNIDDFDASKREMIPKDGIILGKTEVEYNEGESAFDVLKREIMNRQIHMEFSHTPIYDSSYIEGIANIYEYDCGELSGWMYSVNGDYPEYGISEYIISPGDDIEIHYTCDLGADLQQDVGITDEE